MIINRFYEALKYHQSPSWKKPFIRGMWHTVCSLRFASTWSNNKKEAFKTEQWFRLQKIYLSFKNTGNYTLKPGKKYTQGEKQLIAECSRKFGKDQPIVRSCDKQEISITQAQSETKNIQNRPELHKNRIVSDKYVIDHYRRVPLGLNEQSLKFIQTYICDIEEVRPSNNLEEKATEYVTQTINTQIDQFYKTDNIQEQLLRIEVIDLTLRGYHDTKQRQENFQEIASFAAEVVYHIKDNLTHPLEFLTEQAQGLCALALFIVKTGAAIVDESAHFVSMATQGKASHYFIEFDEALGKTIHTCIDKLSNLSYEKIKPIATKIIADTLCFGGIDFASRKIATAISTTASAVNTTEKVAKLSMAQRFLSKLNHGKNSFRNLISKVKEYALSKAPVATTAEGVEVAIQDAKHLVNFSEAAEEIAEKKIITSDIAHSAFYYEKLKDNLSLEEIKSIIITTKHGLERLLERGFSANDINICINHADIIKTQSDGALAYIKKINDRYNVIVVGEQGIITCLKNISEKSLNNLSKNYDWNL